MAKFLFYPAFGLGLAATLAAVYKPAVLSSLFFWLALLAVGGADLPAFDLRWREAVQFYRVIGPNSAKRGGALVDVHGEVQRIYGDGLILVRPDDHVAAVLPMSGGLSAVQAYLGIIGRG